jgi:hypothetical protein
MKRVVLAGFLALALGALTGGRAQAQMNSPYKCGVICLNLFPHIHQHGPLYNYGPYYGYPPFEPYGPWTSDLRYNGQCGNGNCGGHGWGLNWNLGLRNRGCDSCGTGGWGHYSRITFNNIFHRTHPLAHRCGQSCGLSCGSASTGCSSCGGHTAAAAPAAVPAAPAQAAQPGVARVVIK